MCAHPFSCCGAALGRRQVLLGLGSLAVAPMLAGCEDAARVLVSSDEMERLGRDAWAQMRATTPLSTDPDLQRTAGTVATRLLRAKNVDPASWEIAVFGSDQVNAFVLPGRRIGIFEGMMRVARSEGELAAVIGHEIGHLDANHPEERVAAQVASDWGVELATRALDLADVPYGREIAAALGLGIEYGIARPYGRRQELEADRLGVTMMERAGYDPRDAVRFWQRMDALPGSRLPGVLSTHPAPRARIEELEGMVLQAADRTAR